MGRPQAAGDETQVRCEPLAKRGFELVRVVADDRDPRRFHAEPQELLREERAVQVGAVAADELAAGDDDEPAGAAQAARVIPLRVTM